MTDALKALSTPAPVAQEGECNCAARFYGDDRNAHQLCCAALQQSKSTPGALPVYRCHHCKRLVAIPDWDEQCPHCHCRAFSQIAASPVPVDAGGGLSPSIVALLNRAAAFLDGCAGMELEVEGDSALEIVEALHAELVEDSDRCFHEDVALILNSLTAAPPTQGEAE